MPAATACNPQLPNGTMQPKCQKVCRIMAFLTVVRGAGPSFYLLFQVEKDLDPVFVLSTPSGRGKCASCSTSESLAWTPKVCNIMAFMAVIMG